MSGEIAFKKPDVDITAELPVVPVGWRVLLRCYEVSKTTAGGLIVPDEVLESEELLSYVGQVVAMGSECYTAITRSGIDMSKIDPKPKVGDWIMYGTYGGQSIKTKAGTKYLIMNDDCIMGIVPDPSVFRVYI